MNQKISIRSCLIAFFSAGFLAFGMYHVHTVAEITEGGVLGAVLLIQHWFHISPAFSSLVLNGLCYLLGWRTFGKPFVAYSAAAAAGYSLFYFICEQFPPLFPQIARMPLLASIVGSIFVGVGSGLCVRVGGATSGDDALAMSLSRVTKIKIQWIYLASDLIVLLLSLSYIPLRRIAYSLLTVILSGQIIGLLQKGNNHDKQ